MIALILNSGTGSRMGERTLNRPKCMIELTNGETILSRQLRQLLAAKVEHVLITTGKYDDQIRNYCIALNLPLSFEFINNPIYSETNYIYSIYLARDFLQDDILLMHGDLVFEDGLIEHIISMNNDYMITDNSLSLPEKDFKAVVKNGKIIKVGIEFFDNAVAAQPFYKLDKLTWMRWLDEIKVFCENGNTNCYAEKALNEVANSVNIRPYNINGVLCSEIDTIEDLGNIISRLSEEG